MNTLNINTIIGTALGAIGISVIGFIGAQVAKAKKETNSFYNKAKGFLDKQENKAIELIGKDNEAKAKQIVVDAVYRTEQLGKELAWDGVTKHSKALEFIETELKKVGLTVTDDDIYNIIKTTVGYINAHK
ncbi:hypothetical protein IAI10_01995 [Clostridium sp. 19966]|uniref:hypothetical protein n=1 Tax=Clostridium sp. 19966 TaxID=2768166 RepID=UPI0028DD68BB|nr:hypothetical protein [Clostridium sp. 19966]MDT8715428.1 hypothetical protein [Clostridium sp. 19966]